MSRNSIDSSFDGNLFIENSLRRTSTRRERFQNNSLDIQTKIYNKRYGLDSDNPYFRLFNGINKNILNLIELNEKKKKQRLSIDSSKSFTIENYQSLFEKHSLHALKALSNRLPATHSKVSQILQQELNDSHRSNKHSISLRTHNNKSSCHKKAELIRSKLGSRACLSSSKMIDSKVEGILNDFKKLQLKTRVVSPKPQFYLVSMRCRKYEKQLECSSSAYLASLNYDSSYPF